MYSYFQFLEYCKLNENILQNLLYICSTWRKFESEKFLSRLRSWKGELSWVLSLLELRPRKASGRGLKVPPAELLWAKCQEDKKDNILAVPVVTTGEK